MSLFPIRYSLFTLTLLRLLHEVEEIDDSEHVALLRHDGETVEFVLDHTSYDELLGGGELSDDRILYHEFEDGSIGLLGEQLVECEYTDELIVVVDHIDVLHVIHLVAGILDA